MKDTGLGLAMAGMAIVLFGSNFVVTKKFPTGDGMFFQWVMCSGVFFVGFILWMIRGPTEHVWEPWACLGGVLWCTGNIWVVPIVQCIGLGLGLVLWGSANMLTGWASGRFGLFGLTVQHVSKPGLNSAGVCVAILALVMFMFVKPEENQNASASKRKKEPLLGDISDRSPINNYDADGPSPSDSSSGGWIATWSPMQKRVFGVVMSLVSGFFYGTNFDPPQYVFDHPNDKRFWLAEKVGPPGNLVDYAFPHFCGIYFASTFYFLCYCAFKRNKPVVFSEICLPGFISGVLWALAEIGWFVANANLLFPVSFPLVAVGPGLVGSLWGVFVFREITGKRNYMVLVAAFATSIASSTMIALSN